MWCCSFLLRRHFEKMKFSILLPSLEHHCSGELNKIERQRGYMCNLLNSRNRIVMDPLGTGGLDIGLVCPALDSNIVVRN